MIRRTPLRFAFFAAVAAFTIAAAQTPEPNTLTAAEKAAGWKLLFDGKTTNGWRGYRMPDMPPQWSVVDGSLTKTRGAKDIVTIEKYADFELMIDWMISPKGNSGIFYRATEDTDHVYWTAPEYQIGEDSTPDSRDIMRSVGAMYDFFPSIRGVDHGPNAWNSTRIVVKGAHVEHWLNGKMIGQAEVWGPEWTTKLLGDSTHRPLKFAPYKDFFGKAKTGFIAIQGDHPGTLSLRNIKIRVLQP